jgi:ABC-type amino acid transport substrate-binding protein
MTLRRHVLAAALLAVGTLVAAPAAADFPDIQKRGTLRVLVVDEDLFFSLKPGTLPGFDRDLLQAFADLKKLKLEVVPLTSWDAMIPSLLEGKGDLIVGGYSVTPARQAKIAFTSEVFPSRKVVITRKPGRVVTTLEQLREETVGTVKGTSMAEAVAAAAVPEAKVTYLASGTLPAALKAGKVTAIVLPVEHAIKEARADKDLQLGLFLGTPGSLAYGVRKEDRLLQAALNEYIENLRKTPTWSRLVVKYLGEDAPETLRKARAQ